MARKLRIQYPGAVYHVMNRGDRQEDIFHDDQDRLRFLETLAEACVKTTWQVHAYCLMPNHFHAVVETPQPNLVNGMKWLLGTYTNRFNRRHKLCGHLFSGRYKALVVDGTSPGYLKTVCDYVHLNPARAGLLRDEQPLRTFPWSSLPEYLKRPAHRPSWLRVDRLLGEHGITRDSAAGRRMFERRVEARRHAEAEAEAKPNDGKERGPWAPVRRGWCLGDADFRKELLGQVHEQHGAHHTGEELREGQEARAERLVEQELVRCGWSGDDLTAIAKTDRGKARIAQRLRRETTMTLGWIAARLQMGSVNTLKNTLRLANSRD